MELKEIINVSLVNTALLQPILLACVTLAGKFGAQGKVQLIVSLVLGILFGGGAYLASLGVPADLAGWFGLVIAALIPGLVASGVYETAVHVAEKYS